MQCKDIPERPILEWLNVNTGEYAWATWGEGYSMPTVRDCMPEGVPVKLQIAKMNKLINRGLVNGCGCGCRGDFYLTDKGKRELTNPANP